jgi:hypothetical protein
MFSHGFSLHHELSGAAAEAVPPEKHINAACMAHQLKKHEPPGDQ